MNRITKKVELLALGTTSFAHWDCPTCGYDNVSRVHFDENEFEDPCMKCEAKCRITLEPQSSTGSAK